MNDQPTGNQNSAGLANTPRNTKCLLASVVIIGCMTAWFIASYHGHSKKNTAVAKDEFSAERAVNALSQILGDQTPHPAGSTANQEVRQRLVAQLEAIGLDVEQSSFELQQVPMCNLLTLIPGNSSVRPILLATHYDSAEQGPGAGDAGSCVAVLLETARILNEHRLSQPDARLKRDVYFLFTDGEEWVRNIRHGLNGAIDFAETHPHPVLQRQPIVLNFDARGAAGPSLLNETSSANSKLLQHVLPALPRPAFTASSFVTVYDLLPNATDFTVFRNAGLQGLNFAFIDDPHRYHTAEDSLEFLDARSVQHHGNNALAIVRHLLDSDQQDFTDTENAVFFTVADHWIVCYPERYAVPLAVVLLLVQLIGTRLSLRRGATVGQIFASFVAITLTVVVSVVCGGIVSQFEYLRPQSYYGFGEFDPSIVCVLWFLAALSAMGVFKLFRKQTSTESTWASVWLANSVVGLLAAIYVPGFSYVMLTAGVAPAILGLLPYRKSLLSVVAIAAAGLFCIPLAYQFGIALGPKMAIPLSGICSVFLAPLFPLFAACKDSHTKPSIV
ncbi:MAG: M28 family peptidase [Fuerstiella sp.]